MLVTCNNSRMSTPNLNNGPWKLNHADYSAMSKYASTDSSPIRNIVILGENGDVDTGTIPETIWDNGGGLYAFPTAQTVATLVSASASDTLGGIGANYVLLEGLNSDYEEISEVVTLNGVTPVNSVNQYFRINFARVVYSGSNKKNVGDITITVDAKTVKHIMAGESIDHTGVFTVPVNHRLFLTATSFNINRGTAGAKALIVTRVYVPEINTMVESSWVPLSVDAGPSGSVFSIDSRPMIPAKADLWYDIEYVSNNDTQVSCTVRGQLVHESHISRFQV